MIRAYVSDHTYGLGTSVAIVHHMAESADFPARIMRLGKDGAHEWADLTPGEAVPPTFTLSDDEARALLESLTRHYHGAEDTRALRRDYDAERQRVDQLTGSLCLLAQSLVAPAPGPMGTALIGREG